MIQNWKEEFTNNYPQLFVKGDEWNWQPDIVNFIEDLLKEERNAVLEEMKREVDSIGKKIREVTPKHLTREYRDTDYMADELYKKVNEVSTIINNLRVK